MSVSISILYVGKTLGHVHIVVDYYKKYPDPYIHIITCKYDDDVKVGPYEGTRKGERSSKEEESG